MWFYFRIPQKSSVLASCLTKAVVPPRGEKAFEKTGLNSVILSKTINQPVTEVTAGINLTLIVTIALDYH